MKRSAELQFVLDTQREIEEKRENDASVFRFIW